MLTCVLPPELSLTAVRDKDAQLTNDWKNEPTKLAMPKANSSFILILIIGWYSFWYFKKPLYFIRVYFVFMFSGVYVGDWNSGGESHHRYDESILRDV